MTYVMDRVKEFIIVNDNGCWEWIGPVSPHTKRPKLPGLSNISRMVCWDNNGAPPDLSMHAAHSCHNRLCINPDHLYWCDGDVNLYDLSDDAIAKIAAGRQKSADITFNNKRDKDLPRGIQIRRKRGNKGSGRVIDGWAPRVFYKGITKYGGVYYSRASALSWALNKLNELKNTDTT